MSSKIVVPHKDRCSLLVRLSLVVPLGFILGCAAPKSQSAQKSDPSPPPPRHHIQGADADDAARFLAGIPGRAASPFQPLEKEDSWKRYSAEFQEKWTRLEATQLATVTAFQKKEIAPVLAKTGSHFVFYPFSGPDVVYLTRFFPDGKVNVLVGLEPVGALPDPKRFTAETLDDELKGWRVGIASLYNRTFFVTSEMDKQFRGRVADGLLPMITILLARTGHTVRGIRFLRLDEQGNALNDDEPEKIDPETGKKRRRQGVEIHYQAGQETAIRKLYYFSTDLAKFGSNIGFQKFLKNLGRSDTLVKSASFLLHWKMTDDFRTFLLENSNMILEDDTGVRYKELLTGGWQVTLFGQYSPPDRPFIKEHQPELAAAFERRENVRPLGFPVGYGTGRRSSHLLLAVRPSETAAAPAKIDAAAKTAKP